MSVDVDAVNERLNGLVTLLQAVGVDSLDKNEADRVSKNFSKGEISLPDARQLNDDQIEAIIKKLQQAQAEAPQIIAALEAQAEARSLTGGGNSRDRKEGPRQQQFEEEEEEEEEEDDDEFDEDANYPMVGSGCSDDISVVSDLTTPTVLTGVPVPEEEHYRDTLPPMIVGGGGSQAPPMMINPTKRKNLVNQVGRASGPGHIPPPRRAAPSPRSGGAAAARRKNYQDTMAKLHENPHHMAFTGPSSAQPAPTLKKQPSSKSSKSSSKRGTRKTRSGEAKNFSELAATSKGNDWESPNGGWDSFESKPKSKSKKSTRIDDDGFLVGGGFDPFGAGNQGTAGNPFKSSAAGDLAFGGPTSGDAAFPSSSSADGFDAFGGGGGSNNNPNPRKSRPSRKPEGRMNGSFSSNGSRKERSSTAGGRQRRSRRASLAM